MTTWKILLEVMREIGRVSDQYKGFRNAPYMRRVELGENAGDAILYHISRFGLKGQRVSTKANIGGIDCLFDDGTKGQIKVREPKAGCEIGMEIEGTDWNSSREGRDSRSPYDRYLVFAAPVNKKQPLEENLIYVTDGPEQRRLKAEHLAQIKRIEDMGGAVANGWKDTNGGEYRLAHNKQFLYLDKTEGLVTHVFGEHGRIA